MQFFFEAEWIFLINNLKWCRLIILRRPTRVPTSFDQDKQSPKNSIKSKSGGCYGYIGECRGLSSNFAYAGLLKERLDVQNFLAAGWWVKPNLTHANKAPLG